VRGTGAKERQSPAVHPAPCSLLLAPPSHPLLCRSVCPAPLPDKRNENRENLRHNSLSISHLCSGRATLARQTVRTRVRTDVDSKLPTYSLAGVYVSGLSARRSGVPYRRAMLIAGAVGIFDPHPATGRSSGRGRPTRQNVKTAASRSFLPGRTIVRRAAGELWVFHQIIAQQSGRKDLL